MIRNKRRTISAENDDVVTQITGTTSIVNRTPTINTNRDILLNIKQKNFWVEDLSNKITNTTITIPLSEYVTRIYLSENYYDKTKINEFIENFGVKIIVLQSKSELPQPGTPKYGNSSYIFFVRHDHMAGSNGDRDIYDEYIWDHETEQYERIGNTDVNLEPYLTKVSFNNWVTNTYNQFVSDTRADIADLYQKKADITYVNNKIIQEEIALVDAIAQELDNAILTINSSNISTFLEMINDVNDNIDTSIAEHNVADDSHIDIRDFAETGDEESINNLLATLTDKINS